MKRLAWALLFVVVVVGSASPALADEQSKEAAWTKAITIGGYVDVRPSFYWFKPAQEDLQSINEDSPFLDSKAKGQRLGAQRVSDVVLYEAAIKVTAAPIDQLRGVITAYYAQGPVDYLRRDLSPTATPYPVFDEAYVQLGDGSSVFAKFGKYYVPISTFDVFSMPYCLAHRDLLSNPLAVGLFYKHKYFSISGHLWNGQFDLMHHNGTPSDEIIDTYALAFNVFPLAMLDRQEINLGGYFLTDATETWGRFERLFNGAKLVTTGGVSELQSTVNYERDVPLFGGYLIGKFNANELLGFGVRGEYATTTNFKRSDYVDGRGRTTALSIMNAELQLTFWETILAIGGLVEAVYGADYFGSIMLGLPVEVDPRVGARLFAGRTSYYHAGGFLRTHLADPLYVGLQFLAGQDNRKNKDMELQIQTRVEF